MSRLSFIYMCRTNRWHLWNDNTTVQQLDPRNAYLGKYIKKRVEQIRTTDSNQGNWQEEQRGEMRSDRWFGENISSALNKDIRESPDAVFLKLSSLDN